MVMGVSRAYTHEHTGVVSYMVQGHILTHGRKLLLYVPRVILVSLSYLCAWYDRHIQNEIMIMRLMSVSVCSRY